MVSGLRCAIDVSPFAVHVGGLLGGVYDFVAGMAVEIVTCTTTMRGVQA